VAPAFYLIACGVVAGFFSLSIPALHGKPLPAFAVTPLKGHAEGDPAND
jgi:hypothetical protein